jgi:hypothetical protein
LRNIGRPLALLGWLDVLLVAWIALLRTAAHRVDLAAPDGPLSIGGWAARDPLQSRAFLN